MIIAKTPLRISMLGGGSDLFPYFREHPALVIGSTINKYIYIATRHLSPIFNIKYRLSYSQIEECNHINLIKHNAIREVLRELKWDTPIHIDYIGDLPSCARGLGSSSAFVVGLYNSLNALNGIRLNSNELAEKAIKCERVTLAEPGGAQDQYWAAFGGLNAIFFHHNSVTVKRLQLNSGFVRELENSILLLYTNVDRTSGEITKSYKPNLTEYQHQIVQIAEEGLNALQCQNIDELGRLLNASWEVKKQFGNTVTNTKVDDICSAGMNAGAIGSKLLGAGGGGTLMFIVPPTCREKVIKALSGLDVIDIKFDHTGSTIIFEG